VGPMRHETVHAYPGKTVHLRFFEAELLSGEPQAIDCAEVAWVHPGDLRRYEFPEADLGLVALLAG
jgi:8-oxo-dGTP diphosphatase